MEKPRSLVLRIWIVAPYILLGLSSGQATDTALRDNEWMAFLPEESEVFAAEKVKPAVKSEFRDWLNVSNDPKQMIASNKGRLSSLHHRLAKRFCQNRLSVSCKWREYQDIVDMLNGARGHDIAKQRPSSKAAVSAARLHNVRACKRLTGVPTAAEFAELVVAGEPTVFSGAVSHWRALKRWTLAYLKKHLGKLPIVLGASPTAKFVQLEDAALWAPEQSCSSPSVASSGTCPNQKASAKFTDWLMGGLGMVLCRPADLAMSFGEFVDTLSAADTRVYLQHFPSVFFLVKLPNGTSVMNITLQTDSATLAPRKALLKDVGLLFDGDWSFADFLVPRKRYVWMGSAGTISPLHFDRYENLIAVVRGGKTFTLFDPGYAGELYGGAPLKSAQYKVTVDPVAAGNKVSDFWRPSKGVRDTEPGHTYSPIDLSDPNLELFPRFSEARSFECRLDAGDMLYVPSLWWHEVLSRPDDEGKAIALNFWYEPYWERLNDNTTAKTLARNKLYDHVAPISSGGLNLARPCDQGRVCFVEKSAS